MYSLDIDFLARLLALNYVILVDFDFDIIDAFLIDIIFHFHYLITIHFFRKIRCGLRIDGHAVDFGSEGRLLDLIVLLKWRLFQLHHLTFQRGIFLDLGRSFLSKLRRRGCFPLIPNHQHLLHLILNELRTIDIFGQVLQRVKQQVERAGGSAPGADIAIATMIFAQSHELHIHADNIQYLGNHVV